LPIIEEDREKPNVDLALVSEAWWPVVVSDSKPTEPPTHGARRWVAKPAQAHKHRLLHAIPKDVPEQRSCIENTERSLAFIAQPEELLKEIEDVENMGQLIVYVFQLSYPFTLGQLTS